MPANRQAGALFPTDGDLVFIDEFADVFEANRRLIQLLIPLFWLAAGALAAGGVAGGDCARAPVRPNAIAAAGISATMARRIERMQFMRYSPWSHSAIVVFVGGVSPSCPGSRRRSAGNLTRKARFRPVSGCSCQVVLAAGGYRRKITTLANPPLFAI